MYILGLQHLKGSAFPWGPQQHCDKASLLSQVSVVMDSLAEASPC